MSFINTTAHLQFMQECQLFIQEFSSGDKACLIVRSDKSQMLQEEIDKLHRLAEEYQHSFSKLPQLIKDYQTLQHRIKVNMRQLQNLQKKTEKNQQKRTAAKAAHPVAGFAKDVSNSN